MIAKAYNNLKKEDFSILYDKKALKTITNNEKEILLVYFLLMNKDLNIDSFYNFQNIFDSLNMNKNQISKI